MFIRTTAIFRCIVTLSNGFHKTVRMTIDKVARMAAAVRQLRDMPWLTDRYSEMFDELEINPKDFVSCKFINERTGESYLELAV